ncbi:hypothetical protein OPV22_031529 [Ensete ventricosum]|uniref:RING-type E3 ubiquitin transferase n=1 Tax=Ensete ventricosum TaxID=4639 RepID=A0AAV8PPB9_ENSVE|nr:hypothetical protein OPV22_031529 [Ensete ventricosum]
MIVDDGHGRVYVVGARDDPDLPLTVVSKDFEKLGKCCSTCGCETLDHQRDHEMLGLGRKKRILPVGTTLTIVGEAIKGDDGKIHIQKPHKGTFYVSQMNIDELTEDYENDARVDDATAYFQTMVESGMRPNATAYTKVIGGLVNVLVRLDEAKNFFDQMLEKEVKPNVGSYELLLKGFVDSGDGLKTLKDLLLDDGGGIEPRNEGARGGGTDERRER